MQSLNVNKKILLYIAIFVLFSFTSVFAALPDNVLGSWNVTDGSGNTIIKNVGSNGNLLGTALWQTNYDGRATSAVSVIGAGAGSPDVRKFRANLTTSINGTNDATACFWAQLPTTYTGAGYWEFQIGVEGSANGIPLALVAATGSTLAAYQSDTGGTGSQTTGTFTPTNAWAFYCVQRSSAATRMTVWRNAVEVINSTVTARNVGTSSLNIGFPTVQNTFGTGTPTNVSNINVWDRALSYAEIFALNNTNTSGYYPFTNTTPTNVTISGKDFYTATNLVNLTANVTFTNGTTKTYSTTTGNITTDFLTNLTSLVNISLYSPDNGGYFSQLFANQNVSTGSFIGSIKQSIITFYGVEKITGNNLSGVNFTTIYATNTTHYMRAQTYNINATKNGYYTLSTTYTATALSNLTTNISYLYNQTINITVRNLLNNSIINTFNGTIFNTNLSYYETFNSTTGTVVVNTLSGYNYTIIISSSGYLDGNTTINTTSNATSGTVYLIKNNQVNLYFYDENTLLPVNNVNYTITGATYALSGSTSTTGNNVNLSGLNNDNYEIRYTQNGGNYTSRSYFLSVPITDTYNANLSLYMLTVSNATSFVLTVTDVYNQPIAGLKASLLRRYAINNVTTYYVVEMMQPSVALQGATPFVGVANTIPYLFRVTDAAGNVLFQGAGTSSTNLETNYLITTNMYIKVQTSSSVFQAVQNFQGLSAAWSNTSTAVQLSWLDNSSTLSRMCLYGYTNSTKLVTTSCATGYSGILSYTYNPVNGTRYSFIAMGTSSEDGSQYMVGQFVDDRSSTPSANWGYLGIFFVFMLVMTISIQFADRPTVMLMLNGFVILTALTATVLGQILKLSSGTSAVVSGTFFVITLILIFIMREEF